MAALLAAPVGWLVIAYWARWRCFLNLVVLVGRLAVRNIDHAADPRQLPADPERVVYQVITVRTVDHGRGRHADLHRPGLPDRVLHGPDRLARTRGLLVVSILLPLWSGYLVKVYAWRLILSQNGVLNWALAPFGLEGPGYSIEAVWIVEATCGCPT